MGKVKTGGRGDEDEMGPNAAGSGLRLILKVGAGEGGGAGGVSSGKVRETIQSSVQVWGIMIYNTYHALQYLNHF